MGRHAPRKGWSSSIDLIFDKSISEDKVLLQMQATVRKIQALISGANFALCERKDPQFPGEPFQRPVTSPAIQQTIREQEAEKAAMPPAKLYPFFKITEDEVSVKKSSNMDDDRLQRPMDRVLRLTFTSPQERRAFNTMAQYGEPPLLPFPQYELDLPDDNLDLAYELKFDPQISVDDVRRKVESVAQQAIDLGGNGKVTIGNPQIRERPNPDNPYWAPEDLKSLIRNNEKADAKK